jgi:predicted lactoylglutathione lyase
MPHVSLIRLAVDDVTAATAFYERLGWMLSAESVPATSSYLADGAVPLAVCRRIDADNAVQFVMHVDTDEEVDDMVTAAVAAGGRIVAPSTRSEAAYTARFSDPGGHVWEVTHEPGAVLGDDGRLLLRGLEHQRERERAANEETITRFVTSADDAHGQHVARLADEAMEELRRTYAALMARFGEEANSVVVATMLALGQRARATTFTTADHWIASAASTLVGGMVRREDPPRG